MSQKHRTYREIRKEFSPERQQKISAEAARINIRLKTTGITQKELTDEGKSDVSL